MKSKDKGKKYIKVTLKNIIICCSFAIIILCCISFYNYYFNKNEVYAKETNNIKTDNIKISNAQLMNLDEIVNNNTQNKQKEEYKTEEVELEYITIYQTNSNLSKGVIQVIQEGREGKQQITKKKIYENGEIISEEQVNSKITKAAVNKIVEVGTNNYKSNYKVKIGDVVYVTSDRAEVMTEPNENTQKVATLAKGKELKIISIQNDWYKISSSDVTGYVKIENTTYINKDNENEQETNISNSSNSILKPSFDMALNRLESLGVINTDQKMRLDNIKTEMKVGNLLRAVGGNSKLNEPSEVIDIPHEYIDYVIYNYNHNAVPKETLERVLAYYKLVIDDVSDKIVESSDDEDDLDDLIGGLDD